MADEQRELELQSFEMRRERIRARLQEIKADADHWNRLHPDEEPIVVDMDLTADAERMKRERGIR